MISKYKRIGCTANLTSKTALKAFEKLIKEYNLIDVTTNDPTGCDVIIALGGDGFMLKVLHRFMKSNIPIYGMNRGSVGFLMNNFRFKNLINRLNKANIYTLYPLEMKVETIENEIKYELAVNEISLLRETNQAAKIRVYIDNKVMLDSVVCDGILVSTPAGSTAYNLAANGPIIPLGASILSMTPISPFRPRRWRGALFSHKNEIRFKVLTPEKRPVSAVADFNEIRDVSSVTIIERQDIKLFLLFDAYNNIEDRIIKEQFMP